MSKKLTLIVVVLEAIAMITMKYCSFIQGKQQKPAASKAYKAAGHRVVKPPQSEYDEQLSRGDTSDAVNLPASGSTADEKIHEKK